VTNVESLGGTPLPTDPPWEDRGDHLFRMRCKPDREREPIAGTAEPSRSSHKILDIQT